MKPFKFTSLLKRTIWGGNRIVQFKNISETECEGIGESWEISNVENDETYVKGRQYDGISLGQLIATLKEKLVGKACYNDFGNDFPILIKFIDARRDLSIQVHPNDEIARQRGFKQGKTEMWFVIGKTNSTKICAGFSQDMSAEKYEKTVTDGTFTNYINKFDANIGDCYFIPAGQVHAIGAGALVIEIQQTSNVTYRIYDYDRLDDEGNKRELHIEEAKGAINYAKNSNSLVHYEVQNNKRIPLIDCNYFNTSLYNLNSPTLLESANLDSFVVLICYEGSCEVITDGEDSTSLKAGETILIPAQTSEIKVIPNDTCKFLEVHKQN